jgi:hypothetical protein
MSDVLATTLERVAKLYDEKDRLSAELSAVNKDIKEIERLAVEQLASSGLDGVRAAGKSWYLRDFWSVTIPASNKEAAVEAAKAAGLDDYISVNSSSLKSWLVDRFKQNGSKGESLASGTPFDGVISEYHERKLSRQTQGE